MSRTYWPPGETRASPAGSTCPACSGLASPATVATAQFAVPVVSLVCMVAIVGDGWLPSTGGLVGVRLVVSPVKPSGTQEGAAELVDVKAVCACSVVRVPKYASRPPGGPYTPH